MSLPKYESQWLIGADEASSVVAELWGDGTFVVDGAGNALTFVSADDVPWLAAGVAQDIERIVFADDVAPQSLAYWFEGCANLKEVANVPAAQDITRAFFDCPKLVELPDDLSLSEDAVTEGAFGFAEAPIKPLETVYRGANAQVLAHDWAADGRILVNPDAPAAKPDAKDEPSPDAEGEPSEEGAGAKDYPQEGAGGNEADSAGSEQPETDDAALPGEQDAPAPPADADTSDDSIAVEPPVQPAPAGEEEAQVNITVPSSVTMLLGESDPNSAIIPVVVENRSERAVAITGARLKRANQDMPGGSWSLSLEGGATTFVQDARFTPLGLEVSFERPVKLAAGDDGTRLVWRGEFSDYGMKTLVSSVAESEGAFVYGSMIWIVSAL